MASQGAATASGALTGAGTGAMVGSVVPGVGTAIGAGVGAVVGGLAGYFGSSSSGDNTSGVNLADPSAFEQYGNTMWQGAAGDFQTLVNHGPGSQAVSDSMGASNDLAALLQNYAQNGMGPTGSQIGQANGLASQLFQPQQTALNQSFIQQNQGFQRQAALMGRSAVDPVMAAKMATGQTNQQAMLNAEQGAFASNYAMQMPGQQLGLMSQRANVLGGLASQAMQNRQALAAMGSGIMQNQQNFRISTAQHYGNYQNSSGGGVGGAMQGGLAGAGAGMSAYNSFANMGGGGGGYNPFGGTDYVSAASNAQMPNVTFGQSSGFGGGIPAPAL